MAEIDLRIQRLDQLFDSLDPAPFHDKAIDRDADAYVRESAGEHNPREPLVLVIHAPATLASHLDDIARAIHAHFALALAQSVRRHHHRRRIGRIALTAGFAILAAALLLRRGVEMWGGSLGDVLAEGLLILAWVALWRPLESITFDSWESREERRLLATLATVPVRFAPADAPAAAESTARLT